MREIGGYLELDELVHREYYPDLVALNSARNALAYVCIARDIKKLYLPHFLCQSISSVCDRQQVSYEYYHMNEDFTPAFDKKAGSGEAVYVVNYYGQLTEGQISSFRRAFGNIVLDNVQAFFSSPQEGIDTIYSCRKFFGVPDGAYLATDARGLDFPLDVSKDRMTHLLGRYEGASAADYYAEFKRNNESVGALPTRYMSRLTRNLLGAIDYQEAKTRRERNWAVLAEALSSRNELKPTMPEGPYAYPFKVEGGLEVKKALATRKVFVPTLWPNVLDLEGCELERSYAADILPLPVDQRYDVDDMKRLVDEVRAACKPQRLRPAGLA